MKKFEDVKQISTKVLIQNYVSLVKSSYLLNNYSVPGINISPE